MLDIKSKKKKWRCWVRIVHLTFSIENNWRFLRRFQSFRIISFSYSYVFTKLLVRSSSLFIPLYRSCFPTLHAVSFLPLKFQRKSIQVYKTNFFFKDSDEPLEEINQQMFSDQDLTFSNHIYQQQGAPVTQSQYKNDYQLGIPATQPRHRNDYQLGTQPTQSRYRNNDEQPTEAQNQSAACLILWEKWTHSSIFLSDSNFSMPSNSSMSPIFFFALINNLNKFSSFPYWIKCDFC